jgi:hypothetical protein
MRGLTASDVLDLYERGQQEGAAERALLMLEAWGPRTTPEVLANMSVGKRDAHLLQLREEMLGPDIEGLANCPGCGESLELSFRVAEVLIQGDVDPAEWYFLEVDGYEVRFRLPRASDLVAIERQADLTLARRALIERCVESTRAGRPRSVARLPSSVVRQVGLEMAASDPQAIVDLRLMCPACDQEQTVSFDIASFLWSEIQAWVPRVLKEVHELASAYGWDESEVLSLSPWRRHAYLAMVEA